MSGPKTTSYRLSDEIDDLSRAVQQLEESARQQAAEARRLEEEERRRAEAERQRREAEARARAEEARRLESIRLERLSAVRATRRRLALMHEGIVNAMAGLSPIEDKPSLPSIPDIEDESTGALEDQLRIFAGIEQRLTEVRARVATSSALADIDIFWLGEAESLAQLLDRFAKGRHSHGAQREAIDQATTRAADVGRIVGHLLEVSVNELPPSFESLVQRALRVESAARFDMLRLELQRQVQQHNERVKARRRGSESAAGWIDRLGAMDTEGRFADLREALTSVRDGLRPWDGELESECRSALEALEQSAQRRRDAKAAAILGATLRDLGYEVDGIAQTLFAEGGAVHFQARGWNDYFMRLRVSPDRQTLHFNMVRSADAPTSAARDLEMEQQWCRGYPELMKTLAARGIETEPLRAVAAGSFAVQAVLPDSLPRRQKSTAQHSAPAAASRLPRQ
jgi:DNA repair exonuclease SbcCD ATPase subunit